VAVLGRCCGASQEEVIVKDPNGKVAPILVVPDMEKALATYTRVFGFDLLRYFDGNDEYVVLERSGAQIHLMKGPRANPNHVKAAHVADVFRWVDELDGLRAAAQDAGLTIARGPERYDSTPLATTELVIADQDGYWFCFGLAHVP
jgi:catechol 2,3-dioxygenase-like lactoylglutathione lyase family enzyme